MNPYPEFCGLSIRITHCLLNNGYTTQKQIREAYLARKIKPKLLRNYGVKSHAALVQWLNTNVETYTDTTNNNQQQPTTTNNNQHKPILI